MKKPCSIGRKCILYDRSVKEKGCLNINLNDFGIGEGISEVIVTTISLQKIPNAAPIGIIRRNNKTFCKVFKNSHTYDNIKATKLLVANIVYDPILFVQSAFTDLDSAEFKKLPDIKIPILKNANAWILFFCEYKEKYKAMIVDLNPLNAKFITPSIRAVNRGFNAVIEATIYGTRYKVFKNKKCFDWIDYYNKIVIKCGNSKDKKAMEMLYDFLSSKEA
ncbi:MAG: DUF447 domain-containing protein [Methanosarcinales archaeon]